MATTPTLKPELLIQNRGQFKTSSALVLNSLFKHYNPPLAKAPELMPSLAPGMQPALTPDRQPQPRPQNGFFNTDNVGKTAEGLGDLISGLASGDLDPKLSVEGAAHESGKQRQVNPASLFSPRNKLVPTPALHRQKDLEAASKKKHEEELAGRRKRKMGR